MMGSSSDDKNNFSKSLGSLKTPDNTIFLFCILSFLQILNSPGEQIS